MLSLTQKLTAVVALGQALKLDAGQAEGLSVRLTGADDVATEHALPPRADFAEAPWADLDWSKGFEIKLTGAGLAAEVLPDGYSGELVWPFESDEYMSYGKLTTMTPALRWGPKPLNIAADVKTTAFTTDDCSYGSGTDTWMELEDEMTNLGTFAVRAVKVSAGVAATLYEGPDASGESTVLRRSALGEPVCHGLGAMAGTGRSVTAGAAPPMSGLKFMEAYKDASCTGPAFVTPFDGSTTERGWDELGAPWDN